MVKKRESSAAVDEASAMEGSTPSIEQSLEVEQERLSDMETNAASLRALDAFLEKKLSFLRERLLRMSHQTGERATGDVVDRAAESTAQDVQCAEVNSMTAAIHRIEVERRLLTEQWRGVCTNGDCSKKIPMARLAYVPGTTVCRDCAGGDRKHR